MKKPAAVTWCQLAKFHPCLSSRVRGCRVSDLSLFLLLSISRPRSKT
jgi:hypothetical protein